MEKNTKLLAVSSVGAVSGYLIGKKVGFNPILASVVTGVITFILAKRCCKKMEQEKTSTKTTTNKESPSNPKNTATDLMSGVGVKGDSFFSGENLNLEDDRLFSAEGDSLTIGGSGMANTLTGMSAYRPTLSNKRNMGIRIPLTRPNF